MLTLLPTNRTTILAATSMAGAAGVLCLLCYSAHNTQPPSVTLPAENDIARMTATIHDRKDSMGIAPLPTFVIPERHYAIILGAMTPTEKHEYPASWEDLTIGQVKIFTKDGKHLTIRFCHGGHNPLCFSVDGIRYVRGGAYKPVLNDEVYADESMLFYGMLRAIHEESITGQTPAALADSVLMQERSKGLRPSERR